MSRKYTDLIDDLLVLEDATGQGASDATLAQSVRVLGLVSHMKEDASEQRAILTAALIQHNLTNEALDDLTNAQSDQAANLSEFYLTATAAQRQLWNSTGTGPNAYLAPNEESQAINLQTNNHSLAGDQTHADDWYGAESHIINYQMGAVEHSLVNQITARASSLRNEAVTTAIITGAGDPLLSWLSPCSSPWWWPGRWCGRCGGCARVRWRWPGCGCRRRSGG